MLSPEQKKIEALELHVENLYKMVETLCSLASIRPDLRGAVNRQVHKFQKIRIGGKDE